MAKIKEFQGYLQVYTGNGKGKTTAALGLALRAMGAGFRVFLGQFLKSGDYSEIKALRHFEPQIEIQQFGKGCFVKGKPSPKDFRLAEEGWKRCEQALFSEEFQLLIFDELNLAFYFGLLPLEEVLAVLKKRPPSTEIVITGRYAPKDLIEMADLVTEMREVKHYYQKGVKARVGIEK